MAEVKTIQETEYRNWTPPRAALQRLAPINRENAISTIQTRVASGSLRAAARTLKHVRPGQPDVEGHFVLLSNKILNSRMDDPFWSSGDLVIVNPVEPSGQVLSMEEILFPPTFYIIGTRFDPLAIDEIADQLGVSTVDGPPSALAGTTPAGRPPATFWDDLWVAMAIQLYNGDLQPDRLAEVERAMHDWLSSKGLGAAEMTVRTRARKLFRAYEAEKAKK